MSDEQLVGGPYTIEALMAEVGRLQAELAEANESADKFCEQSLRDLGAAAKLEEQLAEARAENERRDSSLKAIQKKAMDRLEDWLENARQASAEGDDADDRHCCRISDQFKEIWDMTNEALAAPAPEQKGFRILGREQLLAHATEREAERRVVEAKPCAIRWCNSDEPAVRAATDCHDDGAWRVSICQRCFDVLGLDRDGADLPSAKEVQELLAAQQQALESDDGME